GYYPCPTICAVETRKSKRAAQFERLRLLASGDLKGSIERLFGSGSVRGFRAEQKLSPDTMQFGIEPMLAGLLDPDDQLRQNVQRGLDLPDLSISQGNRHSPEGLAEIAIAVMKQCPASPHLRKSTYPVAGTPLRQAAEVRAGSYIQGHRMLAGQCK